MKLIRAHIDQRIHAIRIARVRHIGVVHEPRIAVEISLDVLRHREVVPRVITLSLCHVWASK